MANRRNELPMSRIFRKTSDLSAGYANMLRGFKSSSFHVFFFSFLFSSFFKAQHLGRVDRGCSRGFQLRIR